MTIASYRLYVLAGSLVLCTASVEFAQNQSATQVATSAVGQVGQRQTRDKPIAGIEPMARIDNRIQNRIQSRIRNRIDETYDQNMNAASVIVDADRRARVSPSR